MLLSHVSAAELFHLAMRVKNHSNAEAFCNDQNTLLTIDGALVRCCAILYRQTLGLSIGADERHTMQTTWDALQWGPPARYSHYLKCVIALLPLHITQARPQHILWHSNESITDHYSVAMVREIYKALEKIKAEGSDWNKSLRTLIFESRAKVSTKCPH
jgi:hypothetical protein